MLDFLKSIKVNILGSAALCIILGIVLVVYPNTSLTLVCRAVGVIVLFTGLGLVFGYLKGGKEHWYGKIVNGRRNPPPGGRDRCSRHPCRR